MKTLEIHIPDEVASKIKQVAKHMGISIEELLRTSFEEKDPARRAIRECRRSGAREERRALSAALVVRYISIEEVVELHRRIIQQSGGAFELRDQGSLESSVLQPLQSFGDQDLYPTLAEKAAALGYFLIQNHPFSTAISESVTQRLRQLIRIARLRVSRL